LVREIDRRQGRGWKSLSWKWKARCEIAVMLDPTRNAVAPSHGPVPRTMFAAAIDRFGGPDVITAHALPVPTPDAGEVLIAVDAAGVGRWDADIRAGLYAGRKPHFPLVLGFDGAGIVAATGSRVRRLKVGDDVTRSGDFSSITRFLRLVGPSRYRESRCDQRRPEGIRCRSDERKLCNDDQG
jgi:hypothetical protein